MIIFDKSVYLIFGVGRNMAFFNVGTNVVPPLCDNVVSTLWMLRFFNVNTTLVWQPIYNMHTTLPQR